MIDFLFMLGITFIVMFVPLVGYHMMVMGEPMMVVGWVSHDGDG